MSIIFLIFAAMLFIVDDQVEGAELVDAYPLDNNGCFYPCYHKDDNQKCSNFCQSLGASTGYCYFFNCKCDDLSTDVRHDLDFPTFSSCSAGNLPEVTTTK